MYAGDYIESFLWTDISYNNKKQLRYLFMPKD